MVKGYGKDIGVDFEVVYLDESTMPKDAKGSTGAAFINKETEKMLIPIDVNKIKNTGSLWGVIAEEVSHIQDGLAGRQDKKVAEDETNDEKGLESLGRSTNDYFKNQYSKNDKAIGIVSDGRDYSNVDFGEHVGDDPATATALILIVTAAVGTAYDVYTHTDKAIANGIENLKDKEKKSKYIKIFKTKGKEAMLTEMAKEFDGAGISISGLSKKLFVIYGATDEIRNLYIHKEKDKDNNDIDMFILDEYAPEYMEGLWAAPETSQNLTKVSNYWKDKLGSEDHFSISLENREGGATVAYPNFTGNREFYSFGNTKLFQSTYGSVKKLENGKYDVDITVMFQYTDRFEDVKNINNSSIAKQGLNKEYEGGKGFSFRTEPKIVTIKKQVNSLDEISGLLENRLKNIDDESIAGYSNTMGDNFGNR